MYKYVCEYIRAVIVLSTGAERPFEGTGFFHVFHHKGGFYLIVIPVLNII